VVEEAGLLAAITQLFSFLVCLHALGWERKGDMMCIW
jgi:hypothetical protein